MESFRSMPSASRRSTHGWNGRVPKKVSRSRRFPTTPRKSGVTVAEVKGGNDRRRPDDDGRKRPSQVYSPSTTTEPPSEITFVVTCQKLRTKPRMTQRDKWAKREVIERWFAFKDLVGLSYRSQKGKTFLCPVAVQYNFYISDRRRLDLDNLVKGINDALNGLAWPDDNIGCVRQFDGAFVHFLDRGVDEQVRVRVRPLMTRKEGPDV